MPLANTLTGLIPTIYAARDIVSRELTGLIPAVSIDAAATRAGINQTIRAHVAPPLSSVNLTPSMTPPTPDSVALSYVDMSITKSKGVQIPWSGDETMQIGGSGPGVDAVMRDQLAQGFRTLANEVEADLAALYVSASRAYGATNALPFASNTGETAQIRKILDDNGAPPNDRHLIINTSAGANLRTLTQLSKVNEAGTDEVQRYGRLINLNNLNIRESAQIKTHTAGTANSSYDTNTPGAATLPVGTTTIGIDTGSGTVVAGDLAVFAGDTNKYIVGTALSGGNIVINAPGLRKTLADGVDMAAPAAYAANMAFHRSAIALLARAPALPVVNGAARDMAVDRVMVTDEPTGLVFEVALYVGYKAMFIEIGLAWGVKAIKPAHMALLIAQPD